MSQTYTTKKEYQSYFDTLTDRIAQQSALWHGKDDTHTTLYVAMPSAVMDVVDEAAAAGFLYDNEGNQIWDAMKTKDPDGMRYLHCGDKTFRIYDDPSQNVFVEEGAEHPQLKQAENLPEKFTTSVPSVRVPEFTAKKPNGFLRGIDSICRFFTGGKYGLPSVEKYNTAEKEYEAICAKAVADQQTKQSYSRLQQALGAAAPTTGETPDLLVEKDSGDLIKTNLEALPDVKKAMALSKSQAEEKKKFSGALYEAMLKYATKDNTANGLYCAPLIDAYTVLRRQHDNKELATGQFNKICSVLASYFMGKDPQPQPLLDLLKDKSWTEVADALKKGIPDKKSLENRNLSAENMQLDQSNVMQNSTLDISQPTNN